MPMLLRPDEPEDRYNEFLKAGWPDIIAMWNEYAPHGGNPICKIDRSKLVEFSVTGVEDVSRSFKHWDVEIRTHTPWGRPMHSDLMSYQFQLNADSWGISGEPIGAMQMDFFKVSDKHHNFLEMDIKVPAGTTYAPPTVTLEALPKKASEPIIVNVWDDRATGGVVIEEVFESPIGERTTKKTMVSMEELAAIDDLRIVMKRGMHPAHRDEWKPEDLARFIRTQRALKGDGLVPPPRLRSVPPRIKSCAVDINTSTDYLINCACWSEESGKIWCDAAKKYYSSPISFRRYMELADGKRFIGAYMPWTSGYFWLATKVERTGPQSLRLIDSFDENLSIDLYSQSDTLVTGVEMFKEYYKATLNFDGISDFVNQVSFSSREDEGPFFKSMRLRTLPCRSRSHIDDKLARRMRKVLTGPSCLIISEQDLILGEAYSIARWGKCTACNPIRFNYNDDVPDLTPIF